MIGELEIVAAITVKLKESFPDIPVHTENTKEGFKKECFLIETIDPQVTGGTEMRETELSVRTTYFLIGRYTTKRLWEVRRILSELFFNMLKVTDEFFITYEEPLEFTYTGTGNLEMLMQLHYIEDLPEEEGDMLEELEAAFREE